MLCTYRIIPIQTNTTSCEFALLFPSSCFHLSTSNFIIPALREAVSPGANYLYAQSPNLMGPSKNCSAFCLSNWMAQKELCQPILCEEIEFKISILSLSQEHIANHSISIVSRAKVIDTSYDSTHSLIQLAMSN